MQKFILKLISFCAIAYIGMLICDIKISQGYASRDSRTIALWNNIFTHKMAHDYDCIIVGDSRVTHGYNPITIDSVLGTNSFNMGLSGRSWPSQQLLQETYRRKGYPAPKLMLVELDYQIFMHREQYLELEQFYPYYYIDYHIHRYLLSKNELSYRARLVPLSRYVGKHGSVMNETFEYWSKTYDDVKGKRGYVPCLRWFHSNDMSETIPIRRFWHDSIEVAHFDEFLSKRLNEGTKVVLVTSPIHVSYFQCQVIDSAIAYSIFDSLAKKHNITWLDYTHSTISYDTANFFNDSHLNTVGAERFSKQLAHDIDSLGLYSANQ